MTEPKTENTSTSAQGASAPDPSTSQTETPSATAIPVDAIAQLARALQAQTRSPEESMRRQPIPINTYDGSSDVDTFLKNFEIIAEHNKWTESEMGLRLRLTLKGDADLMEVGDSYATICRRLRQKFALKGEQALTLLKKLKFKLGDDSYRFESQLRKIVSTAYTELGEEQIDTIVLREFLSQIPSGHPVRWAMRITPPKDMPALHQLLEAFQPEIAMVKEVQTEEKPDDGWRPAIEGLIKSQQEQSQVLHQTLQCLLQFQTQLQDTMKTAPPANPAPVPQTYSAQATKLTEPRPAMLCWNCQRPGHLRRNCPLLKSAGNAQVRKQ